MASRKAVKINVNRRTPTTASPPTFSHRHFPPASPYRQPHFNGIAWLATTKLPRRQTKDARLVCCLKRPKKLHKSNADGNQVACSPLSFFYLFCFWSGWWVWAEAFKILKVLQCLCSLCRMTCFIQIDTHVLALIKASMYISCSRKLGFNLRLFCWFPLAGLNTINALCIWPKGGTVYLV